MKTLKPIKILFLMLFFFLFIMTSNFSFESSDGEDNSIAPNGSIKSLNVYSDYKLDLVIQPYVYYPPSSDNPLIYNNINISNNPPFPHNEPSVKISRKNPNRVVAAWRDFRINYNPYRKVGYSYSSDGGATWSASVLIDSTYWGEDCTETVIHLLQPIQPVTFT